MPLQGVKIPVTNIFPTYIWVFVFEKETILFLKHLYAVHAALRNLNSPVQIVEHCQYITPTLTPYLAEIYQIKNPNPTFSHSELDLGKNLMIQSHEEIAKELQLSKEGKLLQKLNQTQQSDIKHISFLGTPAKRAPH